MNCIYCGESMKYQGSSRMASSRNLEYTCNECGASCDVEIINGVLSGVVDWSEGALDYRAQLGRD